MARYFAVSHIRDGKTEPYRLVAVFVAWVLAVWFAGWFFYYGDEKPYRAIFYLLVLLPMVALCSRDRIYLTQIARDPVVAPAITLVALAILSLTYQVDGPSAKDSVNAVRYGVQIVVFLAGFALVSRRVPQVNALIIGGFALAGLVAALYFGAAHVVGVGDITVGGRLDPKLTFGHNTIRVGNLFAPTIAAGLAIALIAPKSYMRALGWLAAVAAFFVVFWTQSRSAMLGSGFLVLVALALSDRWRLFFVATGALAALGVIAVAGNVGARDLTDPTTVDYRIAIFKDALSNIARDPFLGHGWMSSTRLVDGAWAHAHNIFLHAWLRGGIIGLIAFTWLVTAAIWRGYRFYAGTKSRPAQLTLHFAIALVGYYLLTGLATARPPITSPDTVWILLWLPIAMIVATCMHVEQQKESQSEPLERQGGS